MPHGRRCALACESWPDSDDYSECPACGEETKRFRNLQPLDDDTARTLRLDLLFEAYYQRRCEQRNVTDDGPMLALV